MTGPLQKLGILVKFSILHDRPLPKNQESSNFPSKNTYIFEKKLFTNNDISYGRLVLQNFSYRSLEPATKRQPRFQKYSGLRNVKRCLRVLPPIFDQTLSAHFSKTDDSRTNRFFASKHLTLKLQDDTISDDTAPSSGSSELIKFKTSNAIYFCYSYLILMTIPPFDWKLNWLS